MQEALKKRVSRIAGEFPAGVGAELCIHIPELDTQAVVYRVYPHDLDGCFSAFKEAGIHGRIEKLSESHGAA